MSLTFNNITHYYPKRELPALNNVNMTVTPGLHLLLGENGAGKSTLLNIAAGLLLPSQGECLLNDTDISQRRPSTASALVLMSADMTMPFGDIRTMARHHAPFFPNFSAEALRRNLQAFDIRDTDRLKKLSLGNRNKAIAAYMLALKPDILLMDEPATGFDIESKDAFQRMLVAETEPTQTVIISTHNYADLQNLYDGVTVMHNGSVVLSAPVDSISAKLRFVRGPQAPADALYSERDGGTVLSIAPARNGDDETAVDFRLLYRALHNLTAAPAVAAAIE